MPQWCSITSILDDVMGMVDSVLNAVYNKKNKVITMEK